jgi:hypothetical protein
MKDLKINILIKRSLVHRFFLNMDPKILFFEPSSKNFFLLSFLPNFFGEKWGFVSKERCFESPHRQLYWQTSIFLRLRDCFYKTLNERKILYFALIPVKAVLTPTSSQKSLIRWNFFSSKVSSLMLVQTFNKSLRSSFGALCV